jgi:hypothetical protein
MDEFFKVLIYGSASWLYLLLFMGIGFLISWRIRVFALVCMVACIYQSYAYANQSPNTPYIWNIILLLLGGVLFLLRLGEVGKMFKDR